MELYQWYSRQAAKLVPLPEGALYPIWLFLKEEEKLPAIAGTVVLTLAVPREQLVITEVERWGYRVNYMYIPLDAEDEKEPDDEEMDWEEDEDEDLSKYKGIGWDDQE